MQILLKDNIGVAPLNITIKDRTYRDKVDISSDEFFEMLPNLDKLPTTSMPSPEEYLKITDSAIEEGYKEILCI